MRIVVLLNVLCRDTCSIHGKVLERKADHGGFELAGRRRVFVPGLVRRDEHRRNNAINHFLIGEARTIIFLDSHQNIG